MGLTEPYLVITGHWRITLLIQGLLLLITLYNITLSLHSNHYISSTLWPGLERGEDMKTNVSGSRAQTTEYRKTSQNPQRGTDTLSDPLSMSISYDPAFILSSEKNSYIQQMTCYS